MLVKTYVSTSETAPTREHPNLTSPTVTPPEALSHSKNLGDMGSEGDPRRIGNMSYVLFLTLITP